MNTKYLVIEVGVYRHRIMGIYDSFADAISRALAVTHEEDSHHRYDVHRILLNTPVDDVQEIGGFSKLSRINPTISWAWNARLKSEYES